MKTLAIDAMAADKPKFNSRTIKLKLRVLGDSPEEKKEAWKRIRQITDDAWRAANWIASGQYLNDQMIRRVYARKKIDPKSDMEAVQAVEAEFERFFETKRQATTERDIKAKFPSLPPCVTNPLNQVVFASYKAEKPDLLMGNRSLRTYRKGMPVTTTKPSLAIGSENGDHQILWKLSRSDHLKFGIFYGRDRANNRLTVQRIIDGENDYSASQIQLKDRDLFVLLVVKEPMRGKELKDDLSVGVDLGVAIPAYVALSDGPQRMAIGSKEDFLKTRTQMQARMRRLQRSVVSAHGGRGRKRKTKAIEQLKLKERNFARSYNHMISKKIIDFAVKNRAGAVKMEMLEGFSAEERNSFILRNWSYFELQSMFEYKAKREGIKVVKIDPYHTSQTCSKCGHFESGQREDRESFKCASCGEKLHADYNAALNIARSKKIVTKKEQTEYHKHIKTAGPTAEG